MSFLTASESFDILAVGWTRAAVVVATTKTTAAVTATETTANIRKGSSESMVKAAVSVVREGKPGWFLSLHMLL